MNEVIFELMEQTFTAVLDDSQTSQEFLVTFPEDLHFEKDSAGNLRGWIPTISQNGRYATELQLGDLYYDPNRSQIVINFLAQRVKPTGNLIQLGKITSDLKFFQQLPTEIKINIKAILAAA